MVTGFITLCQTSCSMKYLSKFICSARSSVFPSPAVGPSIKEDRILVLLIVVFQQTQLLVQR